MEDPKDSEMLKWLYRDEDEDETVLNIKLPTDKYGKGYSIMQKMGYKGNGPIRKRKGVVEPIDPLGITTKDKKRLGYDTILKETTSKQLNNIFLTL